MPLSFWAIEVGRYNHCADLAVGFEISLLLNRVSSFFWPGHNGIGTPAFLMLRIPLVEAFNLAFVRLENEGNCATNGNAVL